MYIRFCSAFCAVNYQNSPGTRFLAKVETEKWASQKQFVSCWHIQRKNTVNLYDHDHDAVFHPDYLTYILYCLTDMHDGSMTVTAQLTELNKSLAAFASFQIG